MASIKCVACNKSHSTVNEVKLCHMQKNVFVDESRTMAPNAKVQKKALAPVAKSYKVETFTSKQEAEEFVKSTPNSQLTGTVKVKSVNTWIEDTQSYQMVTTKTYTVIVK